MLTPRAPAQALGDADVDDRSLTPLEIDSRLVGDVCWCELAYRCRWGVQQCAPRPCSAAQLRHRQLDGFVRRGRFARKVGSVSWPTVVISVYGTAEGLIVKVLTKRTAVPDFEK